MQVVRVVGIGDLGITSRTGFDRVDVALGIVTLQAYQARVDDPFAVGGVVGTELVLVVVGELGLIVPIHVDRVDLRVSEVGDRR